MELFSRSVGKGAAVALCVLGCCAAVAAETTAAENLLTNPGFEQYDQGLPVGWNLFVQPREGASGTLDRNGKAVQGRNAILLSADTPYEKDPFNNWSQNIVQDFKGKTVILKGAIRTENATDAAMWVQCWRKDPWSMLASSGSSTAFPMGGTKDWTRVEVRLKAPRGTDYVTVRCVLSGTGKAWFDDLSLTTEAAPPSAVPSAALSLPKPPPSPPPAAQQPAPETAAQPVLDANSATMSSLMGLLSGETKDEGDVTPTLRMPVPPVRPVAPPRATALPKRSEAAPAPTEDKSMQELVNANRMLMESYQALQETNAELAAQVKAQQKEIESLRRQQRPGRGASRPAPKATAPAETPEPAVVAPEPEPEPEAEPPEPEEPAPPLVASKPEESR